MSFRALKPSREATRLLPHPHAQSSWRLVALALLTGALLASACGSGDEPKDFAEFADQIAAAAAAGDVAFFTDRIEGRPYTCSATEVALSKGPEAPERPICLDVGYTFNSVYIQNYPGSTTPTTVDVLAEDLERYFADAVNDAEDEYGPGAVRLYATGVSVQPPAQGRNVRSAILTAIHEQATGEQRTARGLDFAYQEGRWVIVGETASSFPLAAELLNAATAAPLYKDWARYQQ